MKLNQLPTFSLFDLSEEKQQAFLDVLYSNRQILWHRYCYYDKLRYNKWTGWFYKRLSNYYWRESYEYDEMISKIKDKQRDFKAIY